MDLSICIVSYNCRRLLSRCLESIREHSGRLSVEVIVADNASTDGTPQMVRERFPEAIVLANEENRGFAGGTNQAMRRASGDVLLMLNPDTEVQAGTLPYLTRFLHERPEAGAAGPAVYGPDGSLQHTCHHFPTLWLSVVAQLGLHRLLPGTRTFGAYDMTWWSHDEPRRVDWLSGACIATRRDVFEHVGALDEGYFMYSEDVDWCYRLSKAGYERWYLPDVRIIHHEAGSWEGAPQERILAAHRANFRFFGKHYGDASEIVARFIVAWGASARGNFWTILGPVLGDREGVMTDADTHFRVVELATDFDETYRARGGA
ncbi:MAG: glycosyltransferase family 2 protein [Armatimonadota bacterium]|nr:glycosyltransferase family 2 protein [Armatimonadota bacterium]